MALRITPLLACMIVMTYLLSFLAATALTTRGGQCIDDVNTNSIGKIDAPICKVPGIGEVAYSDEDDDELSAIQTHKIELVRLNPGSRSFYQHDANKSHSELDVAASPSTFLFKLVDTVYKRLLLDGQTPAMPADLLAGAQLARVFLPVPESGILVHIEPGPPVPLVLGLVSKVMTVVTAALLVFTVLGAFCGYYTIFPKPTPMREEERAAYAEELEHNRWLYFWLVSGISCQLFITDQYLPSFAHMSVDLQTNENMLSLSLQINWMVKGLSAIFCGFFADHVGRKNLMVATAVMQVLGSLSCGLATDINWFLAGRIFQGVAEGGEVLGMMITRDVIDDIDKRMAWMIGLLGPSIVIPIFAPSLGGLLAAAVGWRVPFVILAVWGAVNGIAINSILRETMLEKIDQSFWGEVLQVASNTHLITLLTMASAFGMLGASVDSNLSIILTYTYHQDLVSASLMLGGLVFGFVFGLILIKAFLETVSIIRQLQISMVVIIFPIVSSFLVAAFLSDKMWIFYLNILLTGTINLIASLTADTLFMQPIKEMSGAGSGLKVLFGMTITSVGSFISRNLVRIAGDEPAGLSNWQGACLVIIAAIYWQWFGRKPPEWAYATSEEERKGDVDSCDDSAIGCAKVVETNQRDGKKVQDMFLRPASDA